MVNIRNFAIIAHVDHGKSTLADRFLEITHVVKKGQHVEQLLDTNPISRERGITIKLAPVKMHHFFEGQEYVLNLIDTPGHVDFSYEVERTLACVESAVLLVDATKGIQAQTVAHTYKACSQNLTIIPVVNKIDAPHAQTERVCRDVAEFLGINVLAIHRVSAKTGAGCAKLLEDIVKKSAPPIISAGGNGCARALIFDSYYDTHKGVIAFVRSFNGSLCPNVRAYMSATGATCVPSEVGVFLPHLEKRDAIIEGDIGYVATGLKDIHEVQIGDTISTHSSSSPLPGYRKVVPMVFSSLFPTDPHDLHELEKALDKLSLNDSSLAYSPIKSNALGSGFRAGFLGLLHADVVRERLEGEYDLDIVLTPPTVDYIKHITDGGKHLYEEPYAQVNVVAPNTYLGNIMKISADARGRQISMDNRGTILYITYDMPLSDLISGYFDRLKSVTQGYGSLDWTFNEYRQVDIDKLIIIINDVEVEELSQYVIADRAYMQGRTLTSKLKELIPQQQFEVRIQAKYRGKVLASTRKAPLRKDVTAKLYGGDRTRKDKLLKKQKKGKKLMKQVGKVSIPKETFMKLYTS